MPQMANITVEDADGASVVYDGIMPSAGDRSPARWKQLQASNSAGLQPVFEMRTQNNGPDTLRNVHFSFDYPVGDVPAGGTRNVKIGSVGFSGNVFLPKGLTTDEWNNAFVQLSGLLASTLIRESIETGYAPT